VTIRSSTDSSSRSTRTDSSSARESRRPNGPTRNCGLAGQATAHLTRRKYQRDPLREQAASYECERCARCVVEPLRVVDHAQERLLVSGFGEETEYCEPDGERARRRSRDQPECDSERVALRVGKTVDELEDRRAELVQRRVVEIELPFDARSPDDVKVFGGLDGVLEQRRLANAGVSVHHEDGAVAAARGIQQPVEHRALALPAEQPPRACADDHLGSMPPGSRTTDFLDSTDRRQLVR
jgi:hypothetical protein